MGIDPKLIRPGGEQEPAIRETASAGRRWRAISGRWNWKRSGDRNGTFVPKIVAPHQTRGTGFDALFTRHEYAWNPGTSGGNLRRGSEPGTDAVQDEVQAWQNRAAGCPLTRLFTWMRCRWRCETTAMSGTGRC